MKKMIGNITDGSIERGEMKKMILSNSFAFDPLNDPLNKIDWRDTCERMFAGNRFKFTLTEPESKYTRYSEVKAKSIQEDTTKMKKAPSEAIKPTKIIRSGPMTIIFWDDGTKTKVRRAEGTPDDPYLAFCAGLAKKIYGNNTRVKKLIYEKTVETKK